LYAMDLPYTPGFVDRQTHAVDGPRLVTDEEEDGLGYFEGGDHGRGGRWLRLEGEDRSRCCLLSVSPAKDFLPAFVE